MSEEKNTKSVSETNAPQAPVSPKPAGYQTGERNPNAEEGCCRNAGVGRFG